MIEQPKLATGAVMRKALIWAYSFIWISSSVAFGYCAPALMEHNQRADDSFDSLTLPLDPVKDGSISINAPAPQEAVLPQKGEGIAPFVATPNIPLSDSFH